MAERPKPAAPESRRLFLACWPDFALQEKLYHASRQLQRSHGGRRVARDKIHLTLLFLGQTAAADERRFCDALAEFVPPKVFAMEISRLGSFPRSGVAWAGPSDIPGELASLQQGLVEIARACGLPVERRAYRPHLTLLRKSRGLVSEAISPLPWPVDSFRLVESRGGRDGVEYHAIARYPLTGVADGVELQ